MITILVIKRRIYEMKPSLAGVVILYNPDDSVLKNIESYASYLDAFYVIDNSTTDNKSLIKKCRKDLRFNIFLTMRIRESLIP